MVNPTDSSASTSSMVIVVCDETVGHMWPYLAILIGQCFKNKNIRCQLSSWLWCRNQTVKVYVDQSKLVYLFNDQLKSFVWFVRWTFFAPFLFARCINLVKRGIMHREYGSTRLSALQKQPTMQNWRRTKRRKQKLRANMWVGCVMYQKILFSEMLKCWFKRNNRNLFNATAGFLRMSIVTIVKSWSYQMKYCHLVEFFQRIL